MFGMLDYRVHKLYWLLMNLWEKEENKHHADTGLVRQIRGGGPGGEGPLPTAGACA